MATANQNQNRPLFPGPYLPPDDQQQVNSLFPGPFLTPDATPFNPESVLDVTHAAMSEGPSDVDQASAIPQTYKSFAAKPTNVTKALATMPDAPTPPQQPAPTGGPTLQPPTTVPTQEEYISQHGHAPIPGAPPQYRGKKLAAMGLFAGLDSIGAALTGNRPTVAPGLFANAQENIDYQRNLPVLQRNADVAAYNENLKGQEAAANIQHLNAETGNLTGGLPFYDKAAQIRNEIQQLWQSGAVSPDDFDKAVQIKMQGVPANFMRFIPPDFINQVKQMPQQPPAFKIEGGTIQPLIWRGKQYGPVPTPGEPPEVTTARNNVIAAQQLGEFAKAAPEVVAQIGPYPLNGTEPEKVAWGKKAEQIKINESSAPKLIVQSAGFQHTASLAPELQSVLRTTSAGRQYVSAEDAAGPQGAYVRKAATDAGVPVVDKDVASTLEDIDAAKKNQDYMMSLIGNKLATDPTGRIFSGPANTIEKLAQSDPALASVGTFRNAAIQSMRAVAGSKGLRINQAEIQMAIDNDIPKITDTLPVAQQKLQNLKTFLDNAESTHLTRNRAPNPATSGNSNTPPPGAKIRDYSQLK